MRTPHTASGQTCPHFDYLHALPAKTLKEAVSERGTARDYYLGEPQKGAEDFAQAIALMPNEVSLCKLYFYVGEKYLLHGDEKQARSYFQKVVDTDVVEFIEYAAAKRRLASLSN